MKFVDDFCYSVREMLGQASVLSEIVSSFLDVSAIRGENYVTSIKDKLLKLFNDCALGIPTVALSNLKPRDQEIGKFYVVQGLRATNFEALKL